MIDLAISIRKTAEKRWPKSKKEVRETLPSQLFANSTSVFGPSLNCTVDQLPDGEYTFCGPDPYRNRKFYGTITVTNGKIEVK